MEYDVVTSNLLLYPLVTSEASVKLTLTPMWGAPNFYPNPIVKYDGCHSLSSEVRYPAMAQL